VREIRLLLNKISKKKKKKKKRFSTRFPFDENRCKKKKEANIFWGETAVGSCWERAKR